MPLPPASEADISVLESSVRVIVFSTHIFDVVRVDGSPVKHRVNLLSNVESLFADHGIEFPKNTWEFNTSTDALGFARSTALTLYQQYKAINDAAEVIGGL